MLNTEEKQLTPDEMEAVSRTNLILKIYEAVRSKVMIEDHFEIVFNAAVSHALNTNINGMTEDLFMRRAYEDGLTHRKDFDESVGLDNLNFDEVRNSLGLISPQESTN